MRWRLLFCLFAAAGPLAASDPPLAHPSSPRESLNLAGWTVLMDKGLLEGDKAAFGEQVKGLIQSELTRIAFILPPDHVEALRKVRIVVDAEYPELKAAQYHPSRDWLVANGYDPDLAKVVHIPRAAGYANRQHVLDQPSVMLHELSHAYHDQVLGFENPEIQAAYDQAVESKAYLSVMHINGQKKRHYALTNAKEYFAECTECFLATNDFYPFVRAELQEHDPGMFALLTKIWAPE